MKKRAILFANGNLSRTDLIHRYITPDSLIIGIDGGTHYALKLGTVPHVIIGDCDSLSKSLRSKLKGKPIEWKKFPPRKNESDFELAIEEALKRNCTKLFISGLLGDRLDHLLTNINFLVRVFKENNVSITIVEGKQIVYFVRDKLQLKGNVGDLVSLIPLAESARGVTTRGLQYQLTGELLSIGRSRGISNVFVENQASVKIGSGCLLVIHTIFSQGKSLRPK